MSQPRAVYPVHGHGDSGANEAIQISAGEPGPGGAPTYYVVYHKDVNRQELLDEVSFQNGPIPEVGVNGVTEEALLAIVVHRLQGFQAGPFSCRENALAITHLQEALHWLFHRTEDRKHRGVEGTMKP